MKVNIFSLRPRRISNQLLNKLLEPNQISNFTNTATDINDTMSTVDNIDIIDTTYTGNTAKNNDNIKYYSFKTKDDFRSYLNQNHSSLSEMKIKIAKKSSGIQSVTSSELLEVALCFGWIDGVAGSIDKDWYSLRYTPRKLKSTWSQKNVDTVNKLFEQGLMHPSGILAVESAKSDGRWQRAYATPTNMKDPEDFIQALDLNPIAKAFYHDLKRPKQYLVLLPIEMATPTARSGRIQAAIDKLAVGKIPSNPTRKSKEDQKMNQAVKDLESKVSKVSKVSKASKASKASKPSKVSKSPPSSKMSKISKIEQKSSEPYRIQRDGLRPRR